MSIDRLINLLAAIALIDMIITVGLAIQTSDILRTAKDWHLVSTGFLVFGARLRAPYPPSITGIAKDNVPVGVVGMLCLLIAALAAGRLMSGRGATSKSFVLATAVRNAGVSLVIVTASFLATAAITSVIAYALFQTVAIVLIALAWGRLSPGIHLVTQRTV